MKPTGTTGNMSMSGWSFFHGKPTVLPQNNKKANKEKNVEVSPKRISGLNN